MDYLRHYSSPLGPMTMAADGERLTGLWFEGQAHYARTLSPIHIEAELPVFNEAAAWLDRYLPARRPVPYRLCISGAPLSSLPYGSCSERSSVVKP